MDGRFPNTPFVLLDDARQSGAAPARLYTNPVSICVARTLDEVRPALDQIEAAIGKGLYAVGFVSYEAGAAFEAHVPQHAITTPLLWFGLFKDYQEMAADDVAAHLPDPAGAWISAPQPLISKQAYAASLSTVKDYIEAGDIYQANLTFIAESKTVGHPLALYAGLRRRAKAGYGGVIWTGEDWFLSASPELFFALSDGKITTKPMKGTVARTPGGDDQAAITALKADPKQRAENLMIVDLLRNDLSRIAEPGSVKVPELFTVETYPTIHTMTSTVTAQVCKGVTVADLIAALFPCGSITGAPKIRAMQIVEEVERHPRGIYTGSIGRLDPDGKAAFNVAIRTLHLPGEGGTARLGLGGGIVADSQLDSEWRECLAKGAFVADERTFDLIETMRFEPDQGILLLDRHLARMGDSARALGFSFDRHAARNDLQAATFRLNDARRIRLLLSPMGQMTIEATPLHPTPDGPVSVAVRPLPVSSYDFRLRHKTSDRSFYEAARMDAGTFEVILEDADGFLTEGSFTNVFVELDGLLLTPPLSRGLLPGVLRAELIATGKAIEADLRAEDLDKPLWIGNASRGLFRATACRS
jgi:para-aminobenzoate synthetase / 4-amino-4-deoxychorismate lyase